MYIYYGYYFINVSTEIFCLTYSQSYILNSFKSIEHRLDVVTICVFKVRFNDTYFFHSKFLSLLLNQKSR